MMMRGTHTQISLMVLGLAMLAVLGGCGGGPSTVVRTNFVEFTPEQQQEISKNSTNEYRIQEGDILKVAFSYEKSLTQENVVVLNDGAISHFSSSTRSPQITARDRASRFITLFP